MKIIYGPRGKAREYAPLAANLYRGCTHKCLYCYAPACTYQPPERFHSIGTPRPGVLEALQKDVKTAPAGSEVFLCFTCDPYQPSEAEHKLTRQAIQILHNGGLTVNILTKSNLAARDFDILSADDKIGATLTFVNPADSLHWEPGAALPAERINMLRSAKQRGLQTWASLEPVIDPEQTLELIRLTHRFVDVYKVGKLNHHPLAKAIDWRGFRQKAVELLMVLDKQFYIKKDLEKYI